MSTAKKGRKLKVGLQEILPALEMFFKNFRQVQELNGSFDLSVIVAKYMNFHPCQTWTWDFNREVNGGEESFLAAIKYLATKSILSVILTPHFFEIDTFESGGEGWDCTIQVKFKADL